MSASNNSNGGHRGSPPWFVPHDLDGVFAVATNIIVVLLLIAGLGTAVAKLPKDVIYRTILPAAGVVVLLGSVLFSQYARAVAERTGRADVTALPFGINTVGLLLMLFFVVRPEFVYVYQNQTVKQRALADQKNLELEAKLREQLKSLGDEAKRNEEQANTLEKQGTNIRDAEATALMTAGTAAWRAGCLAALGAALVELLGVGLIFGVGQLRLNTGNNLEDLLGPGVTRTALMSSLAGIAVSFIAVFFVLEIWSDPLVAMLPLGVILVAYLGRIRLPLGIPGEVVALAVGAGAAWTLGASSSAQIRDSAGSLMLTLPTVPVGQIFGGAESSGLFAYTAIWIPIGLYNLVGNLQNVEKARETGDDYDPLTCCAANAGLTALGGLLGSPFVTTLYIGHKQWKQSGACSGYVLLTGAVVALVAFSGSVGLLSKLVPAKAAYPVMLWVAVAIVAQSFASFPVRYAPSAAVGLIPPLAAWGFIMMQGLMLHINDRTLDAAPSISLLSLVTATSEGEAIRINGLSAHGLLVLERGFVFTSILLSAVVLCVIDRQFWRAALWMGLAAALTSVGVMHSYVLVKVPHTDPSRQYGNAVGYALLQRLPAETHTPSKGREPVSPISDSKTPGDTNQPKAETKDRPTTKNSEADGDDPESEPVTPVSSASTSAKSADDSRVRVWLADEIALGYLLVAGVFLLVGAARLFGFTTDIDEPELAPTDTAPTPPASAAESKPPESKPADSATSDAKSAETPPASAAESKPPEGKPADSATSDAKSAETPPASAAESKPPESKPADSATSDAKSAETPPASAAESKPPESKPADSATSDAKSAETPPAAAAESKPQTTVPIP